MSREAEEEQSTLRFPAQFDSAKTAKKLERDETSKGRGLFQQPALMFAVNRFVHRTSIWLSPVADFSDAHGRRRGLRRRLSKLSYAGWLPHDRGFVLGCVGLESERRQSRLIVGARIPEPRPASSRGHWLID